MEVIGGRPRSILGLFGYWELYMGRMDGGLTSHNGRTVAPEEILFESPCRANSETKMAKA